jgi:hypothetical protein
MNRLDAFIVFDPLLLNAVTFGRGNSRAIAKCADVRQRAAARQICDRGIATGASGRANIAMPGAAPVA